MDEHVGRNEAEVGMSIPRHFSFYPEADFSLCSFVMPARGGGMGVLL